MKGNESPAELAQTLARVQAMRRELVRREIVDGGRIDILANHILGYQIRPFHTDLLDYQSRARELCLQLAPRGYGKSTVLTIARTVFEVLRNPDIRILIASNTQLQAEVFLREIKFHLENNPKVKEYFGALVSDGKWDNREVVVAGRTRPQKESTVTAVGVGGPVASRHYDLIIADDIVDEENSRTELQREKTRTWWYKTLVPCCEPNGRIYMVGTRYHYLDLYGHLIRNECADSHHIVRAIDANNKTPWPEKFSLKWLEKRKSELGSTIFNSQYQNDTSLMKGHIFQEGWFRFYERKPDWGTMRFYVGTDPAATRRDAVLSSAESNSDWWTIVVGARRHTPYGQPSSPIYVKEILRTRCTKDQYLNMLIAVNDHYKPVSVTIETVAAQEYLAQDAERHMPVKRVTRTTDKVARAYWLQAFFENGQILFPARSLVSDYKLWQALMEELILFPQAEHDDLFDGLQTMVEGVTTHDRSPPVEVI